MTDSSYASSPLLGRNEVTFLERITRSLHEQSNDSYLNPERPLSREELKTLLSELPAAVHGNICYHTIRALGTVKDENLREAVNLLASFQRAFEISLSCNNGAVDLQLGVENDTDGSISNGFLRAGFGDCDCDISALPKQRSKVWSAMCKAVRCDLGELERSSSIPQPGKWLDSAAAVVINSECTVRVLFVPAESEWLSGQLKKCFDAEKKLVYYLKHRPHISVNYGESNSASETEAPLLSSIRFKKSENTGSSSSMSLTLSEDYSVTDKEYEMYEIQLQHRLRLLQQSEKCGWFVRLEVCSDNEADTDAEILRAILASVMLNLGFSCEWRKNHHDLASVILPAYMLPSVISFPAHSFVGFRRKISSQLELNPPDTSLAHNDSIEIGTLVWNGAETSLKMQIPRQEMNRHAIVFGMTGGGKTNTVCNMLSGLHDLHYLIIEPVKGEYHSLPGIKRFIMEAGTSHSLAMNPFWFPDGAKMQYHIDSLKLVISSAFDLYAAMPNILEQCLYRIYSNCGWNIANGENIYRYELPEEELYPTFQSLCSEVERYLNESAFDSETSGNYRGALLSRLQSFTSGAKGIMLNTNRHIDFTKWSGENIVVELDALADDSDKAVVMGTLMIQYFEHIKANCGQSDTLRHLFVLEEAHHLFRETGHSDAASQLVSMLNNLLAEIRAYGEGFIIVDQSPSSISSSALKNTAVKIVHRVDYGEDIKLLQGALLLPDGDNITASLAQGDALVRFGTMQAPAWVRIPRYLKMHTDKDSIAIDSKVGIIERVCGNEVLLARLHGDCERILNTVSAESSLAVIQKIFMNFMQYCRQWVAYYCGWENIGALDGKVFMSLLGICVTRILEQRYPGQFCLQRMIRMFVRRICDIVCGDVPMTEKQWGLLKDYRSLRINMRRVFFYQNSEDTSINSIIRTLGTKALEADTGILKQIIDSVWGIHVDDSDKVKEVFSAVMKKLFCDDLSEYIYKWYYLLAREYCVLAAEKERG